MILNKIVILLIFLLSLSLVNAEDCYERVNPETGMGACCENPSHCVDINGKCITCPRCEKVIQEIDFSNFDIASIPSVFEGNWVIERDTRDDLSPTDVLSQDEDDSSYQIVLIPNASLKNYATEIKAKIISADYSDAFSLIFYMEGDNKYYEYKINDKIYKRYPLGEEVEIVPLSPVKATTCNKINEWCTVKVDTKIEGEMVKMRVYVNGDRVFDNIIADGDGYQGGKVGLKTHYAHVHFDDFVLSESEFDAFDIDKDGFIDRCDYCPKTLPDCITYFNGCEVDLNSDGRCDTVMELLYDQDRDGYITIEQLGHDCNDYDKNINPGAEEICDDNKDNNCDKLIDCDDSNCFKFCSGETEEVTGEEIIDGNEVIGKSLLQKIVDFFRNLF